MLRSPNRGIEVPGISLLKDFGKAQREYHQAWVAGDTNQETTPFVWSLVLLVLATFGVTAPSPKLSPPTPRIDRKPKQHMFGDLGKSLKGQGLKSVPAFSLSPLVGERIFT